MNLRLVNRPNGLMAYHEAVKLIKEVTEGADTEFMEYLVRRGISIWLMVPRSLHSWLRLAMNRRASHLSLITPDELCSAALEARPDCISIFNSEPGRKWLEASFLPKGE
jgi:hypothetical protein